MKHHINIKQLEELSEDQKSKLKYWWKPMYGDWLYHTKNDCCYDKKPCNEEHLYHCDNDEGFDIGNNYNHRIEDPKEEYLPLLSIGQMIELLADEDKNLSFNRGQGMNGNDQLIDYYNLTVSHKTANGKKNIDNLCDALWEAVKECL